MKFDWCVPSANSIVDIRIKADDSTIYFYHPESLSSKKKEIFFIKLKN